MREAGHLLPPEIITDQPWAKGVPVYIEQASTHRRHSPRLRSTEKLCLGERLRPFRGQIQPEQGSLCSQAQEGSIDVKQAGPSEPGSLQVHGIPPHFPAALDFITHDFRPRSSIHPVEITLMGHRGRKLAPKALSFLPQFRSSICREIHKGPTLRITLSHEYSIARHNRRGRIHRSEHAGSPRKGIICFSVFRINTE